MLALALAAALSATPSVVCLGDSITAGIHARKPYPQVLRSLLAKEATVVEGGVSGDLTGDLLVRWRRSLRARHASWVVVLGGVNDVNQGIPPAVAEANLLAIFAEAREDGTRVLAVTILPEKGAAAWSPGAQERLLELNRFLRAQAASGRVALLDAYRELAGAESQALSPALDSGDHLHPNSLGAERLAALVAAALRKSGLAERPADGRSQR